MRGRPDPPENGRGIVVVLLLGAPNLDRLHCRPRCVWRLRRRRGHAGRRPVPPRRRGGRAHRPPPALARRLPTRPLRPRPGGGAACRHGRSPGRRGRGGERSGGRRRPASNGRAPPRLRTGSRHGRRRPTALPTALPPAGPRQPGRPVAARPYARPAGLFRPPARRGRGRARPPFLAPPPAGGRAGDGGQRRGRRRAQRRVGCGPGGPVRARPAARGRACLRIRTALARWRRPGLAVGSRSHRLPRTGAPARPGPGRRGRRAACGGGGGRAGREHAGVRRRASRVRAQPLALRLAPGSRARAAGGRRQRRACRRL